MCELLGVSAKRVRRVNDLLRSFYAHAVDHPHGWGLAVFGGAAKRPSVEREAVSAVESAIVRDLLAEPVAAQSLIAHIRRATIGEIRYENCHPFTVEDNRGRFWTLAHNGTVFAGALLNGYWCAQNGDTDSERILLHLVARIDSEQTRLGRALGERERFDLFSGIVAELAQGNKLNLIVFDGEVLYVHVNFRDSLFYRQDEDALVFATSPLDAREWKPVPFARLVAAKDGEIVREGEPHGHEYVYNPEDYRLVYMNFARL